MTPGMSGLTDLSLPESQPGIATLPFEPAGFLIVSDLHISGGRDPITNRYRPHENFLAGGAFAEMLRHYDALVGAANQVLILNGDTFDFVRIDEIPRSDQHFREWGDALRALGVEKADEELRGSVGRRERKYGLQSDDFKSIWKLDRMARGHPEFFAGIGWWVTQGGTVVFVKGNHDVELYWPLVQRALRLLVGREAGSAAAEERVQFVQAGLRIANVYVEHGHMFESVTAVIGSPVLPSWPTQLRFPLGSFVNRYVINKLEHLDPFLDNVKPVERMLRTLVQKHPLRVLAIIWRGVPLLKRAFRHYWWKEWLAFAVYFGSLALSVVTIGLILAAFAFPEIVASIPQALRPVLSVLGAAAPWLGGLARDLFSRRKPEVGEDRYAAGLFGRLVQVPFDPGANMLYGVLGHTHRPDVQALPPIAGAPVRYLNSGTWVALWDDERPDRAGRVSYSVLVFARASEGGYHHQSMEWASVVGRLVPATILAPAGGANRTSA